MECNFLDEVSSNVSKIKKYNKKTIFTIATTTKQETKPYTTPIRTTNDFCVTGCLLFNQNDLLPLLKTIDGFVDIVLVDTEKKIPIRIHEKNKRDEDINIFTPYETVGYVETGNLSKICFQNIHTSEIYEFKPNDLTVNATWSFLSQKLHFLSGKKISILGAGNIGSKLALKLVECGADVHLYRRDAYKGYSIEQGLNFIKPENTISNIQFHQNIIQASFMSDVVIGATSGQQIIDKTIISSVKKDCIIIDLGKNNITQEAITLAKDNSMEIYRTDVTSALEGYIYELLRMQNILKNSYGKKELNGCTLVGGGYFGSNGDIVVDSINDPKNIFGISAGDGSMKNKLNANDKDNIQKMMRVLNIEN